MRTGTRSRLRLSSSAILLSMLLGSVAGCSRDPNVRKQKYLESGERYAAKGKMREAVIQFSNALKVDSNFGEAHYQLAEAYLKQGMLQPGYIELLRTVDLQPSNLKARLELGNLSLAGHDPDRATEQARAILSADPKNADAHALLASVASSKGNHAEALTQIQQAIAIDPNRASFHAALGAIESADPAHQGSAEEQLRQSVAMDPKSVINHLVLASFLERKGDLHGAETEDQAAVQADPKSIPARSQLTALYLRQNNPAAAEATLREGTNLLADSPQGAQLLSSYYVSTGQISHGAAVYKALVAKHPKSVPMKVAYARLLLGTGDLAAAKSTIAEIGKMRGATLEAAELNGMLLLREGNAGAAVDSLQKAEARDSSDPELNVWLGRAALAAGNPTLAQQSFKDAARLRPGNIEAQEGLAQLAMEKRDYDRLIQIANATLTLRPSFAQAYLWRGTAEASQNQLDKADADFQLAMKYDPKSAAAALELGEIKLMHRQFPQGTELLEQALRSDPNSTRALKYLASYDLYAKQPAKAIDRVRQQIARVPQNQEMYNLLATLQVQTGDLPGALATMDSAMRLSPLESETISTYTRVQVLHGDVSKAIASWEQWSAKHPNDAQVYAILGTLEQSRGDQGKATTDYDKALQLQPEQPVAANNLAYLITEQGQDYDRALTLAQSARRAMPDSPSTADTLAWVYYHKSMYGAARDLLEDAIKKSPDNPSIQYHLGMTYSKLSDKKDASLHLKRAATLAPNTQTAKDANQALNQLG